MSEIPRTYPSWLKGEVKSAQKEYTEPTKLLADDGTLLSPGWARHMVFDYDRTKSTPTMRRKEWDFYQISDGRYMIQISFANISIGGYASAALVDLRNPKKNKKLAAGTLTAPTALFLGGKDHFWDDVLCHFYAKESNIYVRKCSFSDTIEIDSFDELCEVDESYKTKN